MLVLSRKKEERIHIGPDIVILITEVRDGVVRLGIEAPQSYEIVRGELKSTWRGRRPTQTQDEPEDPQASSAAVASPQ